MRKTWLAPVLIVIGIVVQLTVLNGLRLPGGGVPDLVLILVAALAMTEGPRAGLIIGFAAGLCLDLAPPGSALIGQYALVFCLAGWAAGRLRGAAGQSALWSAVLLAIVAATAETLSAVLGLALEPAQVTLAGVRAILPATIGYDLLLSPFVLSLVVLAGRLLGDGLAGGAPGSALAAPARSRRSTARKHRPLSPHLREAAARVGDGWLGGGPRGHGTRPPARTRARLRAGNGVAGSASGLARHPGRAASAPVSIRLTAARRGDGAIGNAVGMGNTVHSRRQPGRHPGMLAGSGRGFRPRGGQPGGSATRQHTLASGPVASGLVARAPAGRRRGQAAIRFGAHRGNATVGRALGSGWLAAPSRPASSGPRLGSGWLAAPGRPASSGPRLRMGASRSAVTGRYRAAAVPHVKFRTATPGAARRPVAAPRFRRKSTRLQTGASRSAVTGRYRAAAVPHVKFRTATPGAARRPVAAPRFRRKSTRLQTGASRSAVTGRYRAAAVPHVKFRTATTGAARRPVAAPRFRRKSTRLRPSATASGLVSGGVLDSSTFRMVRRRTSAPRLRLASRGRVPGMLGGSGRSALRRPAGRIRKQPKFGYGKRSLLSFPAVRRIGGRWLAGKRAGRRSGAWLIGRRTGGVR